MENILLFFNFFSETHDFEMFNEVHSNLRIIFKIPVAGKLCIRIKSVFPWKLLLKTMEFILWEYYKPSVFWYVNTEFSRTRIKFY